VGDVETCKTDRIFQKDEEVKKMSYPKTESWTSRNLIYITIASILIPGFVLLGVLTHDTIIDREEILYIIYDGDSCEKLFHALSYEDRKILRDQTETKVISNFILENNC